MTETAEPFVIYTTSAFTCPYCVRAKAALAQNGHSFDERDIADPIMKAELLDRRPSARTVPQIFLQNGYHIGGCDDLLSLIQNNTLDLIIQANEGGF